MTLYEMLCACGGRWQGPEELLEKSPANIVVDSRQAGEGSLFIALHGERTDGHKYIPDVLQKGALAVLCEETGTAGEPRLVVSDVMEAMRSMASVHRQQMRVPFVGVTGSVGKTTAKEMIAAALSGLEAETLAVSHVLIVSGEDWNPGLIGLTAGRLCERFHMPVIALSLHGDTAVGSCRSIPGVHIFRMLSACEDLLDRFGGHEQAAGLTVKRENIPRLRQRLEQVISERVPAEYFLPSMDYDLEVPFRTWTPRTLDLLSRLEPTGCGNPPPLFLLREAEVQSLRKVGRDGSHLRLSVLDEDLSPVEGIAFGFGETADQAPRRLDLLYRPILNHFRGRASVEAQVSAINPV